MSVRAQMTGDYLVGVISDTHGFLRPGAVKALEDADLIIHAGDIGKPEILEALREVAPVFAVRGNMDWGEWTCDLPEREIVEIGEVLVYVLHDANQLDLEPAAAGFSAVISGHTHRPSIDKRNGVLFLNPGTAGPFRSPASVALLHLRGSILEPQLVPLESEP
jgi:putative phosphoesterase